MPPLAVGDWPLLRLMKPPVPQFPEPTEIDTDPDRPLVATSVPINIIPEFPEVLTPVLTIIIPLTPEVPPFDVYKITAPLLRVVP